MDVSLGMVGGGMTARHGGSIGQGLAGNPPLVKGWMQSPTPETQAHTATTAVIGRRTDADAGGLSGV